VGTSGAPAPTILASGENFPSGIAIEGATLYWTNQGSISNPVGPGEGLVMSIPAVGGTPTALVPAQKDPKRVISDGTSIFFTNGGYETDGGTAGGGVFQAGAAGAAPTLLTAAKFPIDLVIVGTNLIFSDMDANAILSVPKTGGAATQLTVAEGVRFMATDGNNTFYTSSAGTVNKLPASGGQAQVLATGQGDPRGIAVDSGYVYWANYGDGNISRVSSLGGAVQVLATGQSRPLAIAADSANAYWTNLGAGTIAKVPISGGAVTAIAADQAAPWGIDLDNTHVYWTNNGNGPNQGSVASLPK
jgi:hypothetical protein